MSKQFEQTVQTVTKNMLRYTSAMECDIQVLIDCLLDVIESKVYTLRKLIKLKKTIKTVKSSSKARISQSQNLSSIVVSGKNEDESLKQLDSLVNDNALDDSQRITSQSITGDSNKQIQQYADTIQDLCCAFKVNDRQRSKPTSEESINTKEDLRKYIYMLIDSIDERRNENEDLKKESLEEKQKAEIKKVGDCPLHAFFDEEFNPVRKDSTESVVYLAKKEYESIIDVLNVILKSYRSRIDVKMRNVAKTSKELTIHENADGKKIKSSDETQSREKKPKLKSTCPTY